MKKGGKLAVFAAAAGLMTATALADGEDYTVAYEKAENGPFGCTQEVVTTKAGVYRFVDQCPNIAGSILIANNARAEKDWATMFEHNKRVYDAGIKEEGVLKGLLESALMRGRLDDAVWAADAAMAEAIITPESALIRAAQAARADDLMGTIEALTGISSYNNDLAMHFAAPLPFMLFEDQRLGTKGSAAEIFTKALKDSEEAIHAAARDMIAQQGPQAELITRHYTDKATMLSAAVSLLVDGDNHEARRTLAKLYIERQAVAAATEMLRAIPEDQRTPADRGMLMMLRRDNAPPINVVPLPAPQPR